MNIIEPEAEQPENGIQPDNSMAVVINVAFVHPVPVIHLVIVHVKMWLIVVYAGKHPEIISRICKQRIIHHLAVVEILKDIGRRPVRIKIGVHQIYHKTRKDLQKEDHRQRIPVKSRYTEERYDPDQNKK